MIVFYTITVGVAHNRWSAWLAFWAGVVASVLANVLAAEPSLIARCISAWPAVAFVLVVEVITRGGRTDKTASDEEPEPSQTTPNAANGGRAAAAGPTQSSQPVSLAEPRRAATAKVRRSTSETRELATKLRAQHPQISQADLARRLGISATRLRQVDRTEVLPETTQPIDDADGIVPSETSARQV